MRLNHSGSILLIIPIIALVAAALLVTIKPYRNNQQIYDQVMMVILKIPGASTLLSLEAAKLRVITLSSHLPVITDPTTSLQVTFNKAVNPLDLQVFSHPFTPLDIISKQDRQVAISAATVWKDQTDYQIIIVAGSKAKDGSSLEEDYLIEFETKLASPLD